MRSVMRQTNTMRPQKVLSKSDSKKIARQPSNVGHHLRFVANDMSAQPNGSIETLKQYLLNSTLHGLRYVGDVQISMFERIFFLLAFLLVVSLSLYFISNIYAKWAASPIIIGLNAVATSISDFPFPAVTICNMNQARRTIVDRFERGSADAAMLESLCRQEMGAESLDILKSDDMTAAAAQTDYSGDWIVFRQFLLAVSQPCAEMLMYCEFATHTERCMELFNTVLTDDGLCCTFNSVHPTFLYQKYNATDEFDSVNDTGTLLASDWTPEGDWPDAATAAARAHIYPRPAFGAGSHMGLLVVLNASINDYYCSSTNSKGFKILLHNPTETPKITDYGFSVSTGRETRVIINPRLSDASHRIKDVPRAQRQCVFASEGNLTYFRTYSRKNCEMECESRIIEQLCGCVQYHMPRSAADTTICGRKDAACYEGVSLAIDLAWNETFACSCLPGCFEIYYKPSMYTATLGAGEFSLHNKFLNDVPDRELNSSISVMHIYYEESIFRSNTKEVLIGFTEFLSSTGGLLGLFMGFSVVSLIEIVYFVTLRPYCVHRQRNKGGAPATVVGDQKTLSSVRANRDANIVSMWCMSGATNQTKVKKPNLTKVLPYAKPAAADAMDVLSPIVVNSVSLRLRGLMFGSWPRAIGADEAVERGKFQKHHDNLQSFPYTE